jgi:Kef-type K+ transport system membrane component KefB
MILSILIILVLGMLANMAFAKIKLPGLLGMIIVGIVVGPYGLNLLDGSILKNSSDIRMIALVVILMRAGLGLEKDLLKSVEGRTRFSWLRAGYDLVTTWLRLSVTRSKSHANQVQSVEKVVTIWRMQS